MFSASIALRIVPLPEASTAKRITCTLPTCRALSVETVHDLHHLHPGLCRVLCDGHTYCRKRLHLGTSRSLRTRDDRSGMAHLATGWGGDTGYVRNYRLRH